MALGERRHGDLDRAECNSQPRAEREDSSHAGRRCCGQQVRAAPLVAGLRAHRPDLGGAGQHRHADGRADRGREDPGGGREERRQRADDQRAGDKDDFLQRRLKSKRGVKLLARDQPRPHRADGGADRRERETDGAGGDHDGGQRGMGQSQHQQQRDQRGVDDRVDGQHPAGAVAVDQATADRRADAGGDGLDGVGDARILVAAADAADEQHQRQRHHPHR